MFGVKITLWTVWFSNTFQTNDIAVPFKFIILILFKNSFLWGFSCKRYFICGRCFRRCWVNSWYWFECFNHSKHFFVFTFLQKFAFKVFNAYYCWRRGLPIFPIDKLYPTIIYLHHLGMKTQGLFQFQFHTSKKDLQHHVYKVTADLIHYQLLSS